MPTTTFLCDHCQHLATTEVTWREHTEASEPTPYVEHSVLVCDADVDVAVASARSFYALLDGETPIVDRFAPALALGVAA